MLGLRLLFRRIRGFDFGRMLVYVREVKKETKMPCLFIVLDMLLCVLLYNVGFFDYHIFGFVHIRRHQSDHRDHHLPEIRFSSNPIY